MLPMMLRSVEMMSRVGIVERAAVPDDEVGARRPGHREALVLRALLGDEVEHDVGAVAVGEVLDRVDLACRRRPRCACAPSCSASLSASGLRSTTMMLVAVSAARHWMPMWPSPPAPITHAGGARVEQRDRLAHRVVGGDAGIGQRRDVLRLGRRVELDAGPGRGEQVLRHAAVVSESPGKELFDAVHVLAGPAGAAQPAGRRRVQDHGVADGDVGHRRADLVHPAGVLVADRVGQRRVHRLGPLALDDVQVGAAHAGAADLDHHVERALDRGLRAPRRRRAAGGTRAAELPSSGLLHLALRRGSS